MTNSTEQIVGEWKNKNSSGLLFTFPADNKLHISFDGKTLILNYPSPNDTDGIFLLEQNPSLVWINDFNDYALSNSFNWKDFPKILDKISEHTAPKPTPMLRDSTDVLRSSREDLESESQEMELPFNVNYPELTVLLQNAVKEAENFVGKDTARFYEDSGIVSVRIDIENIISDQLAVAMDLTNQEPVAVTFNFREKRSYKDHNTPPLFSVSQRTKKDTFGVKFHLKQIVQSYVQDNWKGEISLAVSGLPAPSPKPDVNNNNHTSVDKNKLAQLMDFGFSEDLCTGALEMTNNNLEEALDKLVNNSVKTKKAKTTPTRNTSSENNNALSVPQSKYAEQVSMFVELGFSSSLAQQALDETDGNWDAAMDVLVSGNFQPKKKQQQKKKRGRNQRDDYYEFSEEGPQNLFGLSLQSSNFFVKLIAYMRARLYNYTNYCIICQKKHACKSTKPLVCCTALCQFRYQDLRFGQLVDGCNVCALVDCRGVDELMSNEEVVAALVACKDTGLPDEVLLDMYQHKYLPNESLLQFIEEGVKGMNVRVAKIENILKPELVARFERKWEILKKTRGEHGVKPEMVYHGTPKERLPSILDKGLLVPGKNNNVQHATDTGVWGKGIYLSPSASVSIGYCRGGNKLLICSVLMGRRLKCTNACLGQPVTPGYDSHVAPSDQEWIVFEEDQVLPCYVVDIEFNR